MKLNEATPKIGEDTGFRDMNGEHILNGDIVRFYNRFGDYGQQIVLFNTTRGAYCVMRHCNFGALNPLDASCYGKIDFRFEGKPHQINNLIIIKHWGD